MTRLRDEIALKIMLNTPKISIYEAVLAMGCEPPQGSADDSFNARGEPRMPPDLGRWWMRAHARHAYMMADAFLAEGEKP